MLIAKPLLVVAAQQREIESSLMSCTPEVGIAIVAGEISKVETGNVLKPVDHRWDVVDVEQCAGRA